MWIFGRQRHPNAELLSEFVDRRLTSTGQQRVSRHVESCASCREELDSLRATISALGALPEFTLPRSFTMPAPPPAMAPVRPSLTFRAPTWAYAGAASVAGLALAIMISADAVGALNPTYREVPQSFQESIESFQSTTARETDSAAADPKAQPQIAAAPEAESMQPRQRAESTDAQAAPEAALAATAPTAEPQIAAAPPAESMQPLIRAKSTDGDAGPEVAAGAAASAKPDVGAVADQAMAAPPPGDAPPALTASEPAAADEATPSTEARSAPEKTANTRKAAQDDRSEPEPKSQPPDQTVIQIPEGEPGSVVVLTLFEDRGTPVIWRVLEGALGALALLFLIGLLLKLRASRQAGPR
ncbi:MAG: zf-HC2 domain-containing protein [Chloroflexi bacterium]|nr:zf-HC2 domain-containing protein [Chloroflexota bacterium]